MSSDGSTVPIVGSHPYTAPHLEPTSIVEPDDPPEPIVDPPSPVTTSHPMVTRSKSDIFKPKHREDITHTSRHALFAALFGSRDPKGF